MAIHHFLRNRRTLDVVLGYGANRDPAAGLAPVLRGAASRVTIARSVTGTPQDPQDRNRVIAGLQSAGARVFSTNAAAARFAAAVALEREAR